MLKLKQLSKLELTGLTSIISQRKCLPVLWSIALLTADLSFSSWSLAAFMPEALKRIDIVYYIYFPWYKKYNINKIKNCRVLLHDSGFDGSYFHDVDFHGSEHAVLQCREAISLLRPLHMIEAWQREQSKTGFLTLTMSEFGIKNVHGYIKAIKPAPSNLFSAHGVNVKAGVVTGRFVRHVADVRKYQFKNKATGQITWLWSTPNHPFYVKNRGGFISVEAISSEDEMLQKDGQIMKMICSTPHGTGCGAHSGESMVSVYNLEIAQKHTYFVGQDSILVHNPYENEPKRRVNVPVQQRFLWLVQNGFIKFSILDASNENKVTLSFELKWADREAFRQCCGDEEMIYKRVLRKNVDYPLTVLGFERIDKLVTSKDRLETPICWVLRDGGKFNGKMEKLGWSVSGSGSLYFDSITSPTLTFTLAPAPVPISIPAFTATPAAISTPAPASASASASTSTLVSVSTSDFDFRHADTFASTSTGTVPPD